MEEEATEEEEEEEAAGCRAKDQKKHTMMWGTTVRTDSVSTW